MTQDRYMRENWEKLLTMTNIPSNAKFVGLYFSMWGKMPEAPKEGQYKPVALMCEDGLDSAELIAKGVDYLLEEGWLIAEPSDGEETYKLSLPEGLTRHGLCL